MPNSIRIIVDASDLARLSEDLKTTVEQLQSSDVIGKVLVKELLDSTDRAFASEKDPNTGDSWPAWSQSYADHLALLNKHHKMLQDKGMGGGGLRSTIQTVAEGSHASIGSNLRYARIHQLGGGDVRPGFPARPYLGLDERGKQKVERKLKSLLLTALKRNG